MHEYAIVKLVTQLVVQIQPIRFVGLNPANRGLEIPPSIALFASAMSLPASTPTAEHTSMELDMSAIDSAAVDPAAAAAAAAMTDLSAVGVPGAGQSNACAEVLLPLTTAVTDTL